MNPKPSPLNHNLTLNLYPFLPLAWSKGIKIKSKITIKKGRAGGEFNHIFTKP